MVFFWTITKVIELFRDTTLEGTPGLRGGCPGAMAESVGTNIRQPLGKTHQRCLSFTRHNHEPYPRLAHGDGVYGMEKDILS